jgi:hypothetical protein
VTTVEPGGNDDIGLLAQPQVKTIRSNGSNSTKRPSAIPDPPGPISTCKTPSGRGSTVADVPCQRAQSAGSVKNP